MTVTSINSSDSKVKKYLSQFWFFIGVVATITGLYATFFPEEIKLNYDVISDTDLLNDDKDISGLNIQYAGENLKDTDSNLRISTILIQNNGNKTLLKDLYDVNDLPGLEITNSRIIETPILLNASNDYLKNNLKLMVESPSRVRFSDVIIEPDDFFVIKIAYLYKNGDITKINSFGKIASVNRISVSRRDSPDKLPFFVSVFSGNFMIQLTRFVIYTIIGFIFVIGFALIFDFLSGIISKLRRKSHIREFKRQNQNIGQRDMAILNRYAKDGFSTLNSMKTLLKNEDILRDKVREYLTQEKSTKKRGSRGFILGSNNLTIKKMLEDNILQINSKGNPVINESTKNSLFALVNFLSKKNIKAEDFDSMVLINEIELQKIQREISAIHINEI